ncbi:hypothetical protein KJ854_06190, partial [Patescibacteria group bacterium]|nr:hypothetical protein [Patescibacteria group bacterium]
MGIKNTFAIFSSMVFTALFFSFIFNASAAGTITLEAPVQDCLNAARIVNLSWTSDLGGNPTYAILRKKVSDASYTEIDATDNLFYQDNTAISDQN